MPRVKRSADEGALATMEKEADEATAPAKDKLERALEKGAQAVDDKVAAIKPWDFKKESLPAATVDKKGRIVKVGESRYWIENGSKGSCLMRAFKSHGGVHKRHVRNLRDDKPKDAEVRKRLRKLGIPGA